MLKAVRDLGLPIGRVVFDGSALSVVIGGDTVEKPLPLNGHAARPEGLIREPKL